MVIKTKKNLYSLNLNEDAKIKIKIQNQNKIKNAKEQNVREWSKYFDYLMDIYNKGQDDDTVDNLLKFDRQRPDQDETTHPKNYQYHYQPPH